MGNRVRMVGFFTGSIVVAFAAWQFLSTVVFNPFLIPPPLVVFKTMVPMVKSGEIFRHVAISLARVGVGFVTGCAAAIVLQTNRIFVALLTICVLGFIFDRLFRMAVDRMLSRYMSHIALT